MSLKHAILGFLSYSPLSGYALKKSFDQSMSHLWPADQSQIYRTLSKMLEDRLVEVEIFPRKDRLARKVYYITDEGEDELERWLITSQDLPVFRQKFLLQVYFGGRLRDDDMLKLLERELEKVRQRLETIVHIYHIARQQHALFENQRENFYSLLTIEHGIMINQCYATWIQQAMNRIELGDYSPGLFDQL